MRPRREANRCPSRPRGAAAAPTAASARPGSTWKRTVPLDRLLWRCGWIGSGRAAPHAELPTAVKIISEAGGPGGVRVPNPWVGICTLAAQARPDVVWEPLDVPCRACAATAVVSGARESPKQRYTFELCRECGDVVVERSLTATPRLVRLDVGNVGREPTSMGVRWLARGLGL